jgi:hypothetical protein
MKKRRSLILLSVLLGMSVFVIPAMAAHSGISGRLRDYKTHSPWMHGATVYVYDNNYDLVVSDTVDPGNSYFTVTHPISTFPKGIYRVEVDFRCEPDTGCNWGDPDVLSETSESVGLDDGTGVQWTGVYEVYSGPNAVTIANSSGISSLALAGVLPMAAVAGLGAVKLNRKKQQ